MHNDDKILVEIAAYCDPDLLTTVKSALIQADNPDRIHFSICYQSDNMEDYKELQKIKNCKIKHLKKSEAKGPCYARYLCQQMIDDEEYVFQIDAHMRFTKHWDNKMIEQLLSIKDKKAMISFYPPSLSKELESLPIDDKAFDTPSSNKPIVNEGKFFCGDTSYFIAFQPFTHDKKEGQIPVKGAFIAAGNFFSFAEIHKTILHDPEMYYSGDELPMSIRYYTHGWNNYCPNQCYVYHKYLRKERIVPKNTAKISKRETEKFAQLIGLDTKQHNLGEYGLGKERTLKQFEEFAGIDFSKKLLSISAQTGQFENDTLRKKVSFPQRQESNKQIYLSKKQRIEVIVIDPFRKYEECIKNCLKGVENSRVQFIIGTTSNYDIDKKTLKKNHIKYIAHFDKSSHYSQMFAELSKHLGNCFAVVIDSGIRFMPEWDKGLLSSIVSCGQNSGLTNWTYRILNNKKAKIIPYLNAQKEFIGFNNYLPVLKQKNSEDFQNIKHPLRTPFISDGFLFCHSSILKSIKPDPDLSYREQQYIYSARLWTSGIDLYYPKTSLFYRTEDDKELETNITNYNVLCGLMGIENHYSIQLRDDYQFKLGDKRPLWGWYDYINYDYTENPDIRI